MTRERSSSHEQLRSLLSIQMLHFSRGLKSAGIKLEQPILSHLREGMLDLASQLNGFTFTQRQLLYYESNVLYRVHLEDIETFSMQKKLMGVDIHLITKSGLNIKLPAKFPKEIVNQVPALLIDVVKEIRKSEIYSKIAE